MNLTTEKVDIHIPLIFVVPSAPHAHFPVSKVVRHKEMECDIADDHHVL